MKIFLFLSILFTFHSVKAQVVEIRGDIGNYLFAALKPSIFAYTKPLIAIRDDHFSYFVKLLQFLNETTPTISASDSIARLSTELGNHKRKCVDYFSTDAFIKWYKKLKTIMEGSYLITMSNVTEKFLTTMKGRAVMTCWPKFKDQVKDVIHRKVINVAYENATKFIRDKYSGARNETKALYENALKSVNDANSRSHFITTKNATIFETINKFMNFVIAFSANQTENLNPILNETFALTLPVYESTLANITDCVVNSRKPKTKATAAVVTDAPSTGLLKNNRSPKIFG